MQDYANAVNDTVNGRTTAAANMSKVPFYYGPTGAFLSGQAYTLDLNTFVQSPHSGNNILTEIFGTSSSNETMLAASGTSSNIGTGGIGFRMPNRSIFGQSPELFAKMTYAFPGGIPNTQQWEFIPAKAVGDNSTRWIGDPSYRWDEIYSADVNTTTATGRRANRHQLRRLRNRHTPGERHPAGSDDDAHREQRRPGNLFGQPAGRDIYGGLGLALLRQMDTSHSVRGDYLQMDAGYHIVGLWQLHLRQPEHRG